MISQALDIKCESITPPDGVSIDADATPILMQTYGTLSNNPMTGPQTKTNKDGMVVINFDQPCDRLHTSMGF